MNLYRKIINGICKAFEFGALFFLVVMIIMMVIQVTARYVFNHIPGWTEELTRQSMVIFVFAGMAVGVREKVHTTLSVIMDSRKMKKIKLPVEIFGKILTLLVGITITVNTRGIFSMLRFNRLAATGIPIIWFYGFIAVVGLLIALVAVYQIYDHFKLGTDEEQTSPEDFIE